MPNDKEQHTTAVSSQGAARRRIINRPGGSFAEFLNALVAYDFCYFQQDPKDFTTYKRELAERMNISPRHLSRFLSGQAFPELRILRRLSDIFPQIAAEGWIPRLGWDPVDRQLTLLPPGSVISTFVGHVSPGDIEQLTERVMKQVASSIDHQQFQYVWVLAPMSDTLRTDELAPIRVVERLRLGVLSAWLNENPEAARDASIEKRISQRIMVFQTKASEEAAHFWSRLPRYMFATNLLADTDSEFSQYKFSAALAGGSVPYPETMENATGHVPRPVATGGWAYLLKADDDDFREMFRKMDEGGFLVNPENQGIKFPRPVLSHRPSRASR